MMSPRSIPRPYRLVLLLIFITVASPAFVSAAEPHQLTRLDRRCLEQSEQLLREVDRRGYVLHDAEAEKYLNTILRRIVGEQDHEAFIEFKALVLRDTMENAISFANGNILVSLGLISRLQNENMLAAVIAHEAAHILRLHPLQVHRDYALKVTLANLSMVVTGALPNENLLFLASLNSYSRQVEREADLAAVELLYQAGYDPTGLIEVLELLSASPDGQTFEEPPQYLRSHPRMRTRMSYIQKAIDAEGLGTEARPNDKDPLAYLKQTLELRHQTIRLNIERFQFNYAVAIIKSIMDEFPDDPPTLMMVGILIREYLQARDQMGNVYNRVEQEPDEQISPQVALAYLKRAIELDPNLAEAYRELGKLYEMIDDPANAITAYRKYIQLKPDAWDRPLVEQWIVALSEPGIRAEDASREERPKEKSEKWAPGLFDAGAPHGAIDAGDAEAPTEPTAPDTFADDPTGPRVLEIFKADRDLVIIN